MSRERDESRRDPGGLAQLPLAFDRPGPPMAATWRDVLYFALLPDAEAIARISRLELGLRRRLGRTWRPCAPARLHLSLLGVAAGPFARATVLAAASRIAAAVAFPPFEVVLTGAASFGGGSVVLGCSEGSAAALTGLHDRLKDAGEDLGLRLGARAFTPHLTVAYDEVPIPETMLDPPIAWSAREIVLVSSEQGRGRHTHLGRWPLVA
ncbi:MAG: 2'-5' RNA ligase family protein [Phenylobacterium sp.]|uniref:2'-5' RNA ligase family protein n=1 Tax=Phenylobacterium sp. TaxID=1871053 RepID=UPI002737349A|nr:2'-5' RNA ligase family protein [Phenylobacterium sp.]MDP3748652.1 2'-5' RNA ligase family protein [Phenylobacterium sp.]